jgi:capsular polysaccharide biosynthesis protein
VSNPVTCIEVNDVRVYFTGDSWHVADARRKTLFEWNMQGRNPRTRGWHRAKHLAGTSLTFGASAGAHCYYHWMLELLPKLGLLERQGIELSSIDHFLVREISGAWQLETLNRFGIDRSRIVETAKQPHIRCDKLLHIELAAGINLKMHRFIPLWMKDLFPVDTSSAERIKLYISRPDGVRRGISNENQIVPLLEDAGFTIMAMEGLTVAEQAALLARTDVLMSPHGGALTNMVFCRPGIKVVELLSRHVFPYYYGLAASCGHKYYAILENPAEDYSRLVSRRVAQSRSHTQKETADLGFEVCVDSVKRVLKYL